MLRERVERNTWLHEFVAFACKTSERRYLAPWIFD